MTTLVELERLIDSYVLKRSAIESYSLDRIRLLLNKLGNPQNNLKVIHLAGTSGKTTTAYYMASLLSSAGYKTGLSVSPHIISVAERAQINLKVDEAKYQGELTKFLELVKNLDVLPTYFEFYVAFAYWYFEKEKVEYAVVETGLGGLMDGTNVVDREDKICVLTDIGLDHVHILGPTLNHIAKQKAGIIQTGNQVYMNNQNTDVIDEVKSISNKQKAHINVLEPSQKLNLGERNWSLAVEVFKYILKKEGLTISDEKYLKAKNISIPARFEIVIFQGRTLLLDGAHNIQKIEYLENRLNTEFPNKSISVLFGLIETKKDQLVQIAKIVEQFSKDVILTEFSYKQDYSNDSVSAELLRKYFKGPKVTQNLHEGIDILLKSSSDILLVTGSLYLVAEVKKHIQTKN